MSPKLALVPKPDAEGAATPTNRCSETEYEDKIIGDARAFDTMRDELYGDWCDNGKKGDNPDDLAREDVPDAHAKMKARLEASHSRSR